MNQKRLSFKAASFFVIFPRRQQVDPCLKMVLLPVYLVSPALALSVHSVLNVLTILQAMR